MIYLCSYVAELRRSTIILKVHHSTLNIGFTLRTTSVLHMYIQQDLKVVSNSLIIIALCGY